MKLSIKNCSLYLLRLSLSISAAGILFLMLCSLSKFSGWESYLYFNYINLLQILLLTYFLHAVLVLHCPAIISELSHSVSEIYPVEDVDCQ